MRVCTSVYTGVLRRVWEQETAQLLAEPTGTASGEGMEVFGLRSLLRVEGPSHCLQGREVRKGTEKHRQVGSWAGHYRARQPWHRGLSVWVKLASAFHSIPEGRFPSAVNTPAAAWQL